MAILYSIFPLLLSLFSPYRPEDKILFNGVDLDGWQVVDFAGHGDISVKDSCIIIGKGEVISGIKWTRDVPRTNYEVSLEAKRVEGSDFFCGLTVPVKDSFITLVIGGWGGTVVGLSSIDGYDASENETYSLIHFNTGQWYYIRLRITDEKIETWINNSKIIDFNIGNYELSLRWEMESSKPFGITTFRTTGAMKNIRLKMLNE